MASRGSFDDSFVSGTAFLNSWVYGSTSQSSGTVTPSPATPLGNANVVLSSGATALTFATPQALYALALALLPSTAIVGLGRLIRMINTNAGTLTMSVPTGGTVIGVLTIATNTYADFVLTINSASTYTIARIGSGTYP